MATDERRPVRIGYARSADAVRFQLENVDEDELRAVLIALWLLLEPASRLDTIRELAHYHEAPGATPPALSSAIATAYRHARGEQT